MAVSKAQHAAHTSMISKVAKFFGPRSASASATKTYSTIPGVGQPMNQMPVQGSNQPIGKGNFPFAIKQTTYGVPGAK